ncbi:MAG TPA: glycoside hydrolase family 38 C-terminal domain-containing protein [Candidatus Lokiarchaeia archaeon]|nr:glycoside hydrolase family 38 C-terminal domain-containing protein [Candidatus Lokiarchaeia archaeon]
MSTEFLDGPKMRKLIKFLDTTKLSVPLVLALKGVIEDFLGNRFKFKQLNMLAVGQSHLDAAWRWRKKQTILKAKATFSKALRHMKEYPRFTFAQPSPCYYEWMKEYYPKTYQDIKAAVKCGQWNLFGGMWVEPDLNLPSGESLVRQRLYGMRFYLREFGKMPDIEFLQDVFGFCYSLPQILEKSGARMFGTGKIFWNDTNVFPIGMFHWRSPDGTTLPTLLIHFGYFLPMNYGKKYPDLYRFMKGNTTPGNPMFDYTTPLKTIRAAQSNELMLNTIFGYGLGDGGHGPIEAEMMAVKVFKLLYPKRFEFYRGSAFYNHFAPYFNRWATWNSELYLEFHRGTYTTNGRVKWYNRKMEILLENCEKACTAAAMLGARYPLDQIAEAWKAVLFNQFHDILPGSSIWEVYEDAFQDYEAAKTSLEALMQDALTFIAARSISGVTGNILACFNALSWSRSEIIEIPGTMLTQSEFPAGELVENGRAQKIENHGSTSYLIPLEAGPTCVKNVSIDDINNKSEANGIPDPALRIDDRDGEIIMENFFLAVKIDKITGYVTSIYHKQSGLEGLDGPANRIMLFGDDPKKFPAWEIEKGYEKKQVPFDEKCTNMEIIEQGPLRCAVEVMHVHDQSKFIQRISLQAHDDLLRFSIDVDWHEQKTLFKLAFPVAIKGDQVVSEIPYACISRPVIPRTDREKARWEYNCQKWLDISDGSAGFGLINDCKYGFNMAGYELRFTVLNSPEYAGPAKETVFINKNDPKRPKYVNQGLHEDIKYAIHLHAGTWQEGTWKKGIEFNNPLMVQPLETNETASAAMEPQDVTSFLSCTPVNVVASVFKVHEDEKNLASPRELVIRVVELAGRGPVDACVILPGFVSIVDATEVDLLELSERNPGTVQASGNQVVFPIGAHEIKTIKVKVAINQ